VGYDKGYKILGLVSYVAKVIYRRRNSYRTNSKVTYIFKEFETLSLINDAILFDRTSKSIVVRYRCQKFLKITCVSLYPLKLRWVALGIVGYVLKTVGTCLKSGALPKISGVA